MRNGFLLFLAVSLIAAAAGAQLPHVGYIGLFTDDDHQSWCANGVGFYQVNMWVWCLPSERGMICAEFAISYPPNVIQSTLTWNPEIQWVIDPPSPYEGISVCLPECKCDWFWLFYQQLWVIDAAPVYVEIIKHPDSYVENIQFANCEPGFPFEPVIKYTNLYINYDPAGPECSGTAAESASWGAIKSLVVR